MGSGNKRHSQKKGPWSLAERKGKGYLQGRREGEGDGKGMPAHLCKSEKQALIREGYEVLCWVWGSGEQRMFSLLCL